MSKDAVIHGLTVITPKQPYELSPFNPFITEMKKNAVKVKNEINHVQCCWIPESKTNANNISTSTTNTSKPRLFNNSNSGVKILL
jgi:hypothetical protein